MQKLYLCYKAYDADKSHPIIVKTKTETEAVKLAANLFGCSTWLIIANTFIETKNNIFMEEN